jgi:hypothetical protein
MRSRPTQLIRRGRKRVSLGLIAVAAILVLSFGLSGAGAVVLPSASYTITGIAGTNGWYRGSQGGNFVRVHWAVSDPDNQIDHTSGCEAVVNVPGPTTGTRLICTIYLITGPPPIAFPTSLIKIDASPPTGVAASPSRAPDFNGWYNHPVGLSWRGSDATSGIASCSGVTYSGPDRASAPVGGGCTDRAGNSASASASINYDATAPVLSKLSVASRAGSDVVRWKSTSPSDTLVLLRRARGNKEQPVVFRGTGRAFADKRVRSNIEYTYTAQAIDQAGNTSRKISVIALPKVLTLQKTPYAPRVAPKPILRWAPKRSAAYYHVQLFRGSKRILAAWPTTHQLGLPAAWRWAGHRYRLRPGHYRWYVWAGLGARSFAHYRAIGSAKFIVPKHSR